MTKNNKPVPLLDLEQIKRIQKQMPDKVIEYCSTPKHIAQVSENHKRFVEKVAIKNNLRINALFCRPQTRQKTLHIFICHRFHFHPRSRNTIMHTIHY